MTEAERFEQLLRGHCGGFASISSEVSRVLMRHYELLRQWNKRLNLTGAATLEEAVVRHYAESLFLATLLPESAGRVADLGSGAEFPGFRWAACGPAVEGIWGGSAGG